MVRLAHDCPILLLARDLTDLLGSATKNSATTMKEMPANEGCHSEQESY
jgi:hypothetical protein